jgi:hypothetical protein
MRRFRYPWRGTAHFAIAPRQSDPDGYYYNIAGAVVFGSADGMSPRPGLDLPRGVGV